MTALLDWLMSFARPKVKDCMGGSWAQLIRELRPGQQPKARQR